jgi:hypothetical protein
MRLLWPFLAVLTLAAPRPADAKAGFLPVPERVEKSDVVAQVRVRSTYWRGLRSEYDYRFVARAKIVRGLKGPASGEIEIVYDNGVACPNVLYATGEECLVFLLREPDGRYSTLTAYNGKYSVTRELLAEVQRCVPSGAVSPGSAASSRRDTLQILLALLVGALGPLLSLRGSRIRRQRLTRRGLLTLSAIWAGVWSLLPSPSPGIVLYAAGDPPYLALGALASAGVLIWIFNPHRQG